MFGREINGLLVWMAPEPERSGVLYNLLLLYYVSVKETWTGACLSLATS